MWPHYQTSFLQCSAPTDTWVAAAVSRKYCLNPDSDSDFWCDQASHELSKLGRDVQLMDMGDVKIDKTGKTFQGLTCTNSSSPEGVWSLCSKTLGAVLLYRLVHIRVRPMGPANTDIFPWPIVLPIPIQIKLYRHIGHR